ncbi:polyphosphate kinase 1 [Helicobacter suis]|uniref:polyphosphate kinase 1 n=1 Tax=Helicobacter suis TaxID=104628 RepID=UPI0001F7A758|nr:polyphosphate kinase 1 [Helicobacter suis]EFX43175.1 polyphosphate kinase [Helicobacter suis HS1]BDR28292.1 polyphosphate kinase [Helicobacter suis HS1]
MEAKDLYFNRELSWLRFNTRVLDQVCNTALPPLERLKFLAIYGTNLDEFYMIRVAGLKHLVDNNTLQSSVDGMSHQDQLESIRLYVLAEQRIVQGQFLSLKEELAQKDLSIASIENLPKSCLPKLQEYFYKYIYPVVIPTLLDPARPFPFVRNLSFGILLSLQGTQKVYAAVKIPTLLKRFIEVEKGIFIAIEEVVQKFIPLLFEHHRVLESLVFRITCNADMEIIEDEGHDLVNRISEGLRTRDRGDVVRLEVGGNCAVLLSLIKQQIPDVDLYTSHILLDLGRLWELVNLKNYAHLKFPIFVPKTLAPLNDIDFSKNGALFDLLDKQDVLLFHPYESFDPIVRFIQSAAEDKDVVSIRMTLYRVGRESPIVKALTEAAPYKQVSVLVELKARFDEENNLHWAKALENAGAHVIYGVPHLKVHAKLALVVRKVGESIKEYVHVSTGNYNTLSARIYTDLSLLTSNPQIASDILKLFHSLSTGMAAEIKLKTLSMAPKQIKTKILALIQEEMRAKHRGRIIFKANALVDSDVIEHLYQASCVGVKIDLLIRGICCLRPQIQGLSENIRVFSIVGKYLEHARIYYFAHDKAKIYFSSADMMPRNLEKRVELLVPSTSKAIQQKLLRILHIQLKDNAQSYTLAPSGEYVKVVPTGDFLNAQIFYEQEVTTL